MRARFRIALLFGFVLAVATAIYFLSPPDPTYQGVPLNTWLRDWQNTRSWEHRLKSEEAVWEVGTNAIPFLLAIFEERDPAFKVMLVQWLEKSRLADWSYRLASQRQAAAVEAFGVLGPKARPALGQLEQMACRPDRVTAAMALWALAATRLAEGIPTIAAGLTNELAGSRQTAAYFAGKLGVHGASLVPALVKVLSDSNQIARLQAAIALRDISVEPTLVVPALTARLTDTNLAVVSFAASALASFGTAAAAAEPALRLLTNHPEPRIRRVASNVLFRVECEVRDGAIIRGPKSERKLALVFTGHEYAEGAETLLDELAKHHAKGSFFLTGAFLTNRSFSALIQRAQREGHLLGPHSDQHLLYCSWDNAPQTLVTQHEFRRDLVKNLEKLGLSAPLQWLQPGTPLMAITQGYFLPAYEHYNRDIADWTRELGQVLLNFTPGTRSTADYTGEADKNFASSQAIFESIINREQQDPNGLNGYLLLLHLGAGPGRKDKFHYRFGELLDFLSGKGYQFVRVDELLDPVLARNRNAIQSNAH